MKAAGILETRGMVALMVAADAMLKAADVTIAGCQKIGSGWVSLIVEGEVAAVQVAIKVGEDQASVHGDVIAALQIPRPEQDVLRSMPHAQSVTDQQLNARAVGLLETQGLAPLVVGIDAMLKAAEVVLVGWAVVGGALAHAVIRGDAAAIRTAVDAGRTAATSAGTVNASATISGPTRELGALMPVSVVGESRSTGALGVLETTGYVSAVAGADAMTKAGKIEIACMVVGSGGRIASMAFGALDDVESALRAGAEAAERVGEFNIAQLVSRPAEGLTAIFDGSSTPAAEESADSDAMGLIETRSTVALVKAVDEMLKAANVRFEGTFKVGYFLTASVVRGDIGAVRAALDIGATVVAKHGELVSVDLIPFPRSDMQHPLLHRSAS